MMKLIYPVKRFFMIIQPRKLYINYAALRGGAHGPLISAADFCLQRFAAYYSVNFYAADFYTRRSTACTSIKSYAAVQVKRRYAT